MSHFSEQTWVDFVRGMEVDEIKVKVEAHLLAACPECASDHAIWERVARLASRERNYAVPDNLLQTVKARFAGTQESESWSPATLVFDSASAPPPVGIRSGMASIRQFVYEGEGLSVDVRFERRANSSVVSASGQILDKEAPLRWLGRAAIVLWNDKGQVLSTTESSECGEFQFEFVPKGQVRMSIATADRRTLRISLGSLE
jgi:anti-sigma factor RsiW